MEEGHPGPLVSQDQLFGYRLQSLGSGQIWSGMCTQVDSSNPTRPDGDYSGVFYDICRTVGDLNALDAGPFVLEYIEGSSWWDEEHREQALALGYVRVVMAWTGVQINPPWPWRRGTCFGYFARKQYTGEEWATSPDRPCYAAPVESNRHPEGSLNTKEAEKNLTAGLIPQKMKVPDWFPEKVADLIQMAERMFPGIGRGPRKRQWVEDQLKTLLREHDLKGVPDWVETVVEPWLVSIAVDLFFAYLKRQGWLEPVRGSALLNALPGDFTTATLSTR